VSILPETLPDLDFAVTGAKPLRHGAAPAVVFTLAVERAGGGPVSSVVLQTQVRIAAARRAYDEGERERLGALFGRPEQWGRSVGSLLWANVPLSVPPFEHSAEVDLLVPLTYDFEVASAQYFSALAQGMVPVDFLFSGTVFYPAEDGQLRTALISWEKEARFRMQASLWREAMEEHFPGHAWVRLGGSTFDRLRAYRTRRALPTWEHTIDELLEQADR
jgi:hypothetical protein